MFHFLLPDGTESTDPNAVPILTLAQSLKVEPVELYTKYYLSSYYELDTRGFITINIPFNGKIVASMQIAV